MTDFNEQITKDIDTEYHRKNRVSNDKEWKRHTDGWIQIQERSRRIKNLRKIPELQNASIGQIDQLIQ